MTVVFADGIRGHYHESSVCFESPQKSYFINQATQKKYLPNFSTPQKSRNWKFKTKSFDQPRHLKFGVSPSPPWGDFPKWWMNWHKTENQGSFGTWYNLTVFHVPDDNFPSSESKSRSIKEVIKATRNT